MEQVKKKSKHVRGRKKGQKYLRPAESYKRSLTRLEKKRKEKELKEKHREEVKKNKEIAARNPLLPPQQLAIEEYFKCFSKTRAYRKIYGDSPNIHDLAYQFFNQDNVKNEVSRRLNEIMYCNQQTQAMFQDRAEVSIEDFTTYDDARKALVYDDKKAEASGKKHLIKKIKLFEWGGIKEIELADPEFSLDKIARIQKQYEDAATPLPISEKGKNALQQILDEIERGKGNTSDSKGK